MSTSKIGQIWTRMVDCITVDILFVILYYSFARYTTGRNMVQETWDLSIISYDCIWIYNSPIKSFNEWKATVSTDEATKQPKCKTVQQLWKTGRLSNEMYESHLTQPSYSQISIQEKWKLLFNKSSNICNQMFIAVLFIIAKNWK